MYVCISVLMLYVQVNTFAVMGWTSTKQMIKWLTQGHNAVSPVNDFLVKNTVFYKKKKKCYRNVFCVSTIATSKTGQ